MSELWIVQRIEGQQGRSGWKWIDVMPRDNDFGRSPAWEATDPGHAFKLAVIDNEDERLASVSYRVLPYTGGATFNVGINVEGTEHV